MLCSCDKFSSFLHIRIKQDIEQEVMKRKFWTYYLKTKWKKIVKWTSTQKLTDQFLNFIHIWIKLSYRA